MGDQVRAAWWRSPSSWPLGTHSARPTKAPLPSRPIRALAEPPDKSCPPAAPPARAPTAGTCRRSVADHDHVVQRLGRFGQHPRPRRVRPLRNLRHAAVRTLARQVHPPYGARDVRCLGQSPHRLRPQTGTTRHEQPVPSAGPPREGPQPHPRPRPELQVRRFQPAHRIPAARTPDAGSIWPDAPIQ